MREWQWVGGRAGRWIGGVGGAGAGKQAEGLPGDCTRGKHQQPVTAAAVVIDHLHHGAA